MTTSPKTAYAAYLAEGPLLTPEGLVRPLFAQDEGSRRVTFGDVRAVLEDPPSWAEDQLLPPALPAPLRRYFSLPRPPHEVQHFLRGAGAPGRCWLARVSQEDQLVKLSLTGELLKGETSNKGWDRLEWAGAGMRVGARADLKGCWYPTILRAALIQGVDLGSVPPGGRGVALLLDTPWAWGREAVTLNGILSTSAAPFPEVKFLAEKAGAWGATLHKMFCWVQQDIVRALEARLSLELGES